MNALVEITCRKYAESTAVAFKDYCTLTQKLPVQLAVLLKLTQYSCGHNN